MNHRIYAAVAALLIVLLGMVLAVLSAGGEIVLGKRASTLTVYESSAALSDATIYSDKAWVGGLDSLDMLLVADVGAASQVVATLQSSRDGSDWTDVVDAGGRAIAMALDAGGTASATVAPVPGRYMRVRLAVTGIVTPTVRGVGR